MEANNKKMSQLMMELYANPELKEDFIKNPKPIMKQKGIEVPENIEIKILEESENVKYIVLPYIEDSEATLYEDMEKRINKIFFAA